MYIKKIIKLLSEFKSRYIRYYGNMGYLADIKIIGEKIQLVFNDNYSLYIWFDEHGELQIVNQDGVSVYDFAEENGWSEEDVLFIKTGRTMDITKEDVDCCDKLVVTNNVYEKYISVAYEFNFDEYEYFGSEALCDENQWLEFYTYWYPDGTIKAEYCIKDGYYDYSYAWNLTKNEKEFFLKKMEDYCHHLYGKSLQELFNTN